MTVDAAHPGVCPSCGERFAADALIRRRELGTPDEGWGHAVCPEPPAVAPPCPRCFQVPSLAGSCGCD